MSHPPHMSMNDWNSAFIPFCAFKTDLNISKNPLSLPGITFPLCNLFLPTILEGQLCYKLTLKMTSGQGKRNELMLLIDYNEDRSLQKSPTEHKANKSSRSTLNFDTAVETIQGARAKVHINTLSPYVSFSRGIYKMSDVKKMTAKNDFLKMPLKDRQCEVELYEDCRTRKLIEECNCGLWEHPGYQVDIIRFVTKKTYLWQDFKKCSPIGRDCIERNSAETFNCNVSCEGFYADVQRAEERTADEGCTGKRDEEMDRQKYLTLLSEYKDFKRSIGQHYRFNGVAETNYGEFRPSISSLNCHHLRKGTARVNPPAGADLL